MGTVITVKSITNRDEWDALVKQHDGHPLQLWGWGEVKAKHGWSVDRVVVSNEEKIVAGAQLLVRSLPWPLRALVYMPRGPWGHMSRDAQTSLVKYAKGHYKAVSILAEPDQTVPLGWQGWSKSPNRILMARTAVMDLSRSLEDLQADMSKKTRQYIRKSEREGIEVRLAKDTTDIAACMNIYKDTAKRAGFALHKDSYYEDIFTNLADDSPVYMAKYQGRVVAFLWPIVTPAVAFELYGGMNDEGQALRANYFLKWHVVQDMKRRGVVRYDVNGLLNDGVTTFKKGFIPDETNMAGAYEKPLSLWYPLWRYMLPLAKKLAQSLRRLGGR